MKQRYIVILHTPTGSATDEVLQELLPLTVPYKEEEAQRLIRQPSEEEVRLKMKVPPDEDVYLVLRKDLINVLARHGRTKALKYFEKQIAGDVIAIPKRCCRLFEND